MKLIIGQIILGVIVAIVLNLPRLLRERNLTKLAKIRLEISNGVLEMEEMMLSGTLKNQELCHDVVFKIMAHNQTLDSYPVIWNFGKLFTKNNFKFREQLHREIAEKDPRVRKLIH